jgi:UPF0716 protein FxsA
MLARLALLFILVPLLELVLLIELGQVVGLWPTLGLVVATGAAGAALARAQGLRTLFAFQEASAGGRLPAQEIQDGLAILVGGALLLTPGLITDIVGFSLLLPPTRKWIQARLRKALLRRVQEGEIQVAFFTPGSPGGPAGPFGPGGPLGVQVETSSPVQEARVIDVESEETDP